MSHIRPEIPHFSIPFRIYETGLGYPAALVTEQDSEEEIIDCCETIIRYEQGYRLEKPEFGIPDQTFIERNPDPDAILEALDRWEPRAEAIVESRSDSIDSLISRIKISIRAGS